MVSAWWVFGAFLIGGWTGILLMALLIANREDDR